MKNDSELYINKIVRSLKEESASVFVGSGFSLNSKPANESVKERMPLWGDLLDYFCELLGMTEKIDEESNKKNLKYLNALLIAQDVANTYGRSELDRIIQEKMKDELFEPAEAHKLLLQLPWNDIFTTNYDTLLERGCKQIDNRIYNVIYNEQDLVIKSKLKIPRIIKLHGSFPSVRPFIITEEDYRTYPQLHALFVNTVQQSLIENTFCLIGFSSDDPNFLNWIGWIRDNLGIENSPRIYMITHNKPNEVLLKRLNSRRIDIVDISEIYQSDRNTNTAELYCRFLRDLNHKVYDDFQKKEDESNDWLYDTSFSSKLINNKFGDKVILKELHKVHQDYPGWLCAPNYYRSRISNFISEINIMYFNNKDGDIGFAYEYCWLSEIGNQDIKKAYLKKLESILEKYDKKSNADCYIYISCILLRNYRLKGMHDEWKNRNNDINGLVFQDDIPQDLINMYMYEKIYKDLYDFNYNNLAEDIVKINIDDAKNKSMWSLRKVSLLMLTERFDEAMKLIRQNLSQSRRIINSAKEINYYYQSIESCFSILESIVSSFVRKSKKDFRLLNIEEKYFGDNEKNFDWENENSTLIAELKNFEYESQSKHTEDEFDLFSKTINHSNSRFQKQDVAFSFILFREATSIPFAIKYVKKDVGLKTSIKTLAYSNYSLPATMAFLSGNKELFDIYNRTLIRLINKKDIKSLFNKIQTCYMSSIGNKNEYSFFKFIHNTSPDIIGRLSVKITNEDSYKLIEIIEQIINDNEIRKFDNTIKIMILSLPIEILIEKLNELIDTLFLENSSHNDKQIILEAIKRRLILPEVNIDDIKSIIQTKFTIEDKTFSRIIKISKFADQEETRIEAMNWLVFIAQISKLDEEQKKSLWNLFELEKDNNYKTYNINSLSRIYPNQLPESYKTNYDQWKNNKYTYVINSFYKCIQERFNVRNSIINELVAVMDFITNQDLLNILKATYEYLEKLEAKFKTDLSAFDKEQLKDIFNSYYYLLEELILDKRLLFSKEYKDIINNIKNIFNSKGIDAPVLEIYGYDQSSAFDYLVNKILFDNDAKQEKAANLYIQLINRGIKEDDSIERLIKGAQNKHDGNRWIIRTISCYCREIGLNEEQKNTSLIYLKDLSNQTEYLDDDSEEIIIDKIITRKYATFLAYEINKIDNTKTDDRIRYWLENKSNSNEFAEVRNAWEDRYFIDQVQLRKIVQNE